MNAAMLGMIIPDRKVPNFCTPTLAREVLPTVASACEVTEVVGAVTVAFLSRCVRGDRAGRARAGRRRPRAGDGTGPVTARS